MVPSKTTCNNKLKRNGKFVPTVCACLNAGVGLLILIDRRPSRHEAQLMSRNEDDATGIELGRMSKRMFMVLNTKDTSRAKDPRTPIAGYNAPDAHNTQCQPQHHATYSTILLFVSHTRPTALPGRIRATPTAHYPIFPRALVVSHARSAALLVSSRGGPTKPNRQRPPTPTFCRFANPGRRHVGLHRDRVNSARPSVYLPSHVSCQQTDRYPPGLHPDRARRTTPST